MAFVTYLTYGINKKRYTHNQISNSGLNVITNLISFYGIKKEDENEVRIVDVIARVEYPPSEV